MTNTDTPAPVRTITLQPAMQENFRQPYPFHVDAATGDVQQQEFWQGDPAAVLGFQDQVDVQRVDLLWQDAAADPDSIVGKYPVMVRAGGGLYTYTVPVESVTVR